MREAKNNLQSLEEELSQMRQRNIELEETVSLKEEEKQEASSRIQQLSSINTTLTDRIRNLGEIEEKLLRLNQKHN